MIRSVGWWCIYKNGFRSDRKYLRPEEKELLVSLRKQLDEKQKVIMDGLLKRLAI